MKNTSVLGFPIKPSLCPFTALAPFRYDCVDFIDRDLWRENRVMIPNFYKKWLKPLEYEDRWESRNCEACEQASNEIPHTERFSLETKCCTYFPFLPNFTLGKLIQESKRDASLKLRLHHAFSQGRVTPLGLFPSLEYEARREELGESGFGRRSELRCPFFHRFQGLCSIWNERPGVCASYFCRSTYENRGQDLRKSLEEYLNLFEWTLAHETLWQLGFTQDDLRRMEKVRKEAVWRPERAWDDQFGQEEEFFVRAFQAALDVQPQVVEELMGEEGKQLRARILHFLTTPKAKYGRVPPP